MTSTDPGTRANEKVQADQATKAVQAVQAVEAVQGVQATTAEDDLRKRAIARLDKRRDFYTHLVVYLMVNGFFVGLWAATSHHGFFWPVFPLAGWGIGIVMNAWDAFVVDDYSESRVEREMRKLQRH